MENTIYKPNCWCIDKHIIVYDIVRSKCKKKLYIIFNYLIHLLDRKNPINQEIKKRTRNYLLYEYKPVLNIQKNFHLDINTLVKVYKDKNQIDYISGEWIMMDNYRYNNTLQLNFNEEITDGISVKLDIQGLTHTISCGFDKIYTQKGDIAAVLLFKNENEFLDRWIEYHMSLGITTFFIFNNNSENKQQYENLQNKYGSSIQFIDWDFTYQYPYGQAQHTCYNMMLNLLRDRFKWILYTDIDEYIVLNTKYKTLQELLKLVNYDTCSTVSFKCRWFGCGRKSEYTPQNFLETLIFSAPRAVDKMYKNKTYEASINGKCLINPTLTEIMGVHTSFKITGGRLFLSASDIRFNHYFTITTWGKERYFTENWKKDDTHQYRKKCNCSQICSIKNTDILEIIHPEMKEEIC